jgi:MFS family permease
MYGFSKLPASHAFYLLAVGLAGILAFIVYELRLEQPVVDMRLFRYNTVFAFSNLAALIHYAATFAVAFLLSLYLQNVRGLSPQEAGLLLVIQPLVQAILSPLAGRLSDRIEPRTVASIGMSLTLVGLILLIAVHARISMYYIAGTLVCLGLGQALFSSPNTNAIISSVNRRIFGVASALVGTMRQLGMMFSMGVVMMLLALHLGQAQIGPDNLNQFVGSMRTVFTVFAVMCLGGIFASLARGNMVRENAGSATGRGGA